MGPRLLPRRSSCWPALDSMQVLLVFVSAIWSLLTHGTITARLPHFGIVLSNTLRGVHVAMSRSPFCQGNTRQVQTCRMALWLSDIH